MAAGSIVLDSRTGVPVLQCTFADRLEGETFLSLTLERNTYLRGCRIGEITSTANLMLENCQIERTVKGRNLSLIHCTWQQAQATEAAIVRGGIFPISAGLHIYRGLPASVKIITHANKRCNELNIPPQIETVFLENSSVLGDVIFKGEAGDIVKRVILRGTSTIQGAVIGGVLVDERASSVDDGEPPPYTP